MLHCLLCCRFLGQDANYRIRSRTNNLIFELQSCFLLINVFFLEIMLKSLESSLLNSPSFIHELRNSSGNSLEIAKKYFREGDSYQRALSQLCARNVEVSEKTPFSFCDGLNRLIRDS